MPTIHYYGPLSTALRHHTTTPTSPSGYNPPTIQTNKKLAPIMKPATHIRTSPYLVGAAVMVFNLQFVENKEVVISANNDSLLFVVVHPQFGIENQGKRTSAAGGITCFSTHTTDPKGISVTTLTNARNQQVKTIAPLGATTVLSYNALGELLSSTDPNGHITSYTYNRLGKLLSRTHPDAGTDSYEYDAAGNTTKHSTQLLSNSNKSIRYYYTYNRLDSVIYPNNPANNVYYTYGDSNATNNGKGKIVLIEDASGFQSFIYGKMGEITENNRTFVLPNESYSYSFKMNYSYDSWNRLQRIVYPDNEEVFYAYNTGGQLRSVYGRKNRMDLIIIGPIIPSTPQDSLGIRSLTYFYYNYVDSIHYNVFEQKIGQWNGNGTRAQYTYDVLQRLSNLKLRNASNILLQNIYYTYDAADNITAINNTAIYTLGGTYNYTYNYDSLYRLTNATGNYGSNAYYTLSMSYLADGRINQKNQSGKTWLNGSYATFSKNYAYTYNNAKPHAVSKIGSTNYFWDANGNMITTAITTGIKTSLGSLTWDEENHLQSSLYSQKCVYYQYDANGERFYKNGGLRTRIIINGIGAYYNLYENPVLYTSPYLVATPQGYTKHYYAGSERLLSKIGDGKIYNLSVHAATAAQLSAKHAAVNATAPDSISPKFSYLCGLTNKQKGHPELYFYHSDHLGSAAWVSDTNGAGIQHLQYMPYGEPLVDRRATSTNYTSRYTFSGKERDSETGFSYFGARYYNSDLSIWLSVDPMADKYPSLSPYMYCAGNPVKLVDPDGREVIPTNALSSNASIRSFFKTAGENKVFQGVMKRFYSNQSNVYVHLAQLTNDGAPAGKNNIARTESAFLHNNPVGKYGQGRIIINSDILNGNGNYVGDQTFLFGCLLHEGMHAKMYDIQKNDLNFSNYPGYKDFVLKRREDGGHHNQMGAFNRQTLIDGMREFDTQIGTTHSDEWYEAVSWVGLHDTKVWRDFERNNPEKANTYKQILSKEVGKIGNNE